MSKDEALVWYVGDRIPESVWKVWMRDVSAFTGQPGSTWVCCQDANGFLDRVGPVTAQPPQVGPEDETR